MLCKLASTAAPSSCQLAKVLPHRCRTMRSISEQDHARPMKHRVASTPSTVLQQSSTQRQNRTCAHFGSAGALWCSDMGRCFLMFLDHLSAVIGRCSEDSKLDLRKDWNRAILFDTNTVVSTTGLTCFIYYIYILT